MPNSDNRPETVETNFSRNASASSSTTFGGAANDFSTVSGTPALEAGV